MSWFDVCKRSMDESWPSQFLPQFVWNECSSAQNWRPRVCHGCDAVTRKVESYTCHIHWEKCYTWCPSLAQIGNSVLQKHGAVLTQYHDHLWLAVCVGELWPWLSMPGFIRNGEPGLGTIGHTCPDLFSSNEGKVRGFLVFSCSSH